MMNRRDFLKILGLFALSPKKIYAQKSKTKEAVIIGAGIIGCSIAYELSKRGVKVTLIDKNPPGSACSGSSFSWINATYPKKPYSYNLFSQLGINAFHLMQRELSLDIKWNGSLEWSSIMKDQEKLIESVNELQSYPKYTPTSIIGHKKAKKLEPHINFRGNENIIFSKADGAINPKDAISKMIDVIKKNGGSVLYPCKFEKIIESNDSFSKVKTSMGILKSENVVFCNGVDVDKSGTDLNPSEVLIGWRPIPKDDLPIIGKFKNKSIYIAVMHSGISLAAIVGNLVSQEIVDEVDSLLLKDFRPSRFF